MLNLYKLLKWYILCYLYISSIKNYSKEMLSKADLSVTTV